MPVTPTMSIKASLDQVIERSYWNEDDNTGDPFIGTPYQWEATFSIQPQSHNSHVTKNPYYYMGTDLQAGDWYASGVSGRAIVIREIITPGDYVITCLVEDLDRYNLFTDPFQQGSGMVDYGPGVFFRLNEEGMPVLGPIEDAYLSPKAVEDLLARFLGHNRAKDVVLVRQELHGFVVGDVIYADFESNSGYKKVDAANFNRAIGIVTEVGVPGLYYFAYRPLGRLINNVYPPLWGEHGDVFYLDPNEPGALTNEKPTSNAVPVYLQLDLPTRAILLERGAESSTSGPVAESETNKYDVENLSAGQTVFTLPDDAKEVLYMAINGIENENFTFDPVSKELVFDPVETGYGVDNEDEVFFIYKT